MSFHRPAAILSSLLVISCTASPSPTYVRKMAEVKSLVKIGSDIHQAKRDLEHAGFDTSDVHDPTKLRKILCMHVHFGILPGMGDTLLYTADIPHRSAPISALVVADYSGKVTEIR